MTVSLCKHRFSLRAAHGIFRPADCSGCGITYAAYEAELARQEQALILGTSRYGKCPDCTRARRLFRWQPQARPWHPVAYEPPVTHLCMDCRAAATNADQAFYEGVLAGEELNR